jgi:hypothetical protein
MPGTHWIAAANYCRSVLAGTYRLYVIIANFVEHPNYYQAIKLQTKLTSHTLCFPHAGPQEVPKTLPALENARESIIVSFTGAKGAKLRNRGLAMSCSNLRIRPDVALPKH